MKGFAFQHTVILLLSVKLNSAYKSRKENIHGPEMISKEGGNGTLINVIGKQKWGQTQRRKGCSWRGLGRTAEGRNKKHRNLIIQVHEHLTKPIPCVII